eukprot:TRINITY_DN26846_c0_g1_i1.p1 TRINITY_DN26846_c0_g1~~TRINITY_DN26846_c0_g1_i1.p1  ORF type:complete len:386 (-),score=62.07 TRINITY_DN26846_c0_g1_i1:30-1187(-)
MHQGSHLPQYRVDPAVLPPVGIRSLPKHIAQGPVSHTARQERLSRNLLEGQSKTFARLGHARIYGQGTLDPLLNGKAKLQHSQTRGFSQEHLSGAQTARLHDPRLRGLGAQMSELRPAELDDLIDMMRHRFQNTGLTNMLKLSKFFRDADVDKSGALDLQEFVQALVCQGMLQSTQESELIFRYFDKDRSGTIDPQEFLNVIKGQLSAKRRAVVQEAFASIDVNGDGVLSVQDLCLKFRSFAHPDVFSGRRTEEEIFSEFLEGFDVISKDGQITLSEFEHYYEHLSSIVPRDEFFIANVRNAWHLHGATGGNCLRVHITLDPTTDADPDYVRGKQKNTWTEQKIVEIRPDLNCSVHDPRFFDAVTQRLKEMGYRNFDNIQVLNRE